MFIVITFMLLMDLIIFIYMGYALTRPKGDLIMGSTLPKAEFQNSEVLQIIKRFKKSNWIFILLSSIAIIPSYFGNSYPGFAIVYFIIYMVLVYFAFQANFYRYVVQIRALKRKNDWYIEKNKITYVDTEVARLKNKMVIKQYWFIPTIIVYLIAFALKVELFMIIQSLFTTILCYIFYIIFKNMRSKTYSKDAEINFACNQIERRVWSIIWTLFAFLYSLTSFLNITNEWLFLIIIFLITFIIIVAMIVGHTKIRDTQNKLLYADENQIVQDEDEYWGMFIYNNPNDPRVMVDKRYGIGTTINFGSKKGKNIGWGTVIFVIIILVISIAPIPILSNSNYSITINDNQACINAPLYGTKFDINQIQSIDIIDKIPGGMRTNGIDTGKSSLGHYNINGYGKSLLYIKNESHHVVVIKLNDEYVFINADSDEETDAYYNQLKQISSKFGVK